MLTHLQVFYCSKFLMFFAPHQTKGAMSQKPVTMEQLKQIIQLKNDGIGIREIARRTGISRNSVRKYLSLLNASTNELSNKELNKHIVIEGGHGEPLKHFDLIFKFLDERFTKK